MRWPNETAFDGPINVAASNYGVAADLIRAIIGQESQFRPSAVRQEPAINDQSIGLMQVLYGTAKGEGYTGPIGSPTTLTGLYDPSANITYGTSYLARQLQRAGGDIERAISAYNGGWRPTIAFGSRATQPLVVCLVRDSSGKCIRSKNVAVGEFANQDYVNAVLSNYRYFRSKASTPVAPPPVIGGPSPPPLPTGNHADESQNGCPADRTRNRHTWARIAQAFVRIVEWIRSKRRS